MKISKTQLSIYKYVACISILLFSMHIIVTFFYQEPIDYIEQVETSTITHEDEMSLINVEYPRFQDDDINKIITDDIYAYVKKFKEFDTVHKELDMSYTLYFIDGYLNILYHVENTLYPNIKTKNLIVDLEEKKMAYISNIYDKDYLTNEINNLVEIKYSEYIYSKIEKSNINNHTYNLSENKIIVHFNDIFFDDIDYIPFVTIVLNEEEDVTIDNPVSSENKKYIAFTFDDGPSRYTKELVSVLELNNSSATFFMLGNKMKYNTTAVTTVEESNSEIGSHTYSHKNLVNINNIEMKNEVKDVVKLYKDITKNNIKYLRPPYGSYNDAVQELGYPLILWNIDTKDWLLKDSKKIYNNIIKNACDGCIVLMHDIYEETIEAVKMSIPELNRMGYEVVSVSKLAEVKNHEILPGEVISSID